MISGWTWLSLTGIALSQLGVYLGAEVLKAIGMVLAVVAVYGYFRE